MPPEPSPRQAAEEKFRVGDLSGCLKDLQAAVKKDPADGKLRIFLAQLLMLQGDWDRAVNQLKVVGEVDASALPMAHAYSTAIQCERLRADVFAGTRGPLLFGEPEPWIAQLMQSLALHGQGNPQHAAELRAQAFDAAPATAGTLNGTAFEWIADADSRLGPVLEVLLNGAYYWVPLHRVTSVTVEPPSDARDLVWVPAQFQWSNGGEAMGLIPVRYPGSERSDDAAIRLARKRSGPTRTSAGASAS
jgi:type VI secretion system protein ImpE